MYPALIDEYVRPASVADALAALGCYCSIILRGKASLCGRQRHQEANICA